jgi:hypothetical protein
MQMAKRVSLSRSNTFYRRLIEIESLALCLDRDRHDRTCRLQHPVADLLPRVHVIQPVPFIPNG